jgi:hypothetical protein
MFSTFSFYTLFPILTQVSLLFIFYEVPGAIVLDVLALPIIFLFLFLFFVFFVSSKLEVAITHCVKPTKWHIEDTFVLLFCYSITLLVPIDIFFNGFKLANPLTYAEFDGVGRYIRHVTNFSWLVTLFCFIHVKRGWQFRWLLIFSLITPILFVDRNRLLMCFFSILLVWYFSTPETSGRKNCKLFIFITAILMLFSLIGILRSGDSFLVETSGDSLVNGYLPLKAYFYDLPVGIQQIILYITTPILNFSYMLHLNFSSDVFLMKQLAFVNRDSFPDYPYSPVLVPRYNVGTEFFPILLYSGLLGVILSSCGLFLFFVFFYNLLCKLPSFFTLVLFVKIAYIVLLVGFAPQFYVFYNFFSLLLILLLILGSVVFRFCFLPFLKLND